MRWNRMWRSPLYTACHAVCMSSPMFPHVGNSSPRGLQKGSDFEALSACQRIIACESDCPCSVVHARAVHEKPEIVGH